MSTRVQTVLRRATSLAVVGVIAGAMLIGTPALLTGSVPKAYAAAGSVYIDEPLQGGSLANWSLQGAGNYSNGSGNTGAAWTPLQSTVQTNNGFFHSINTNGCGIGVTTDQWPTCTAVRSTTRDSAWLTLTSDNTNNGGGQAGTALHNTAFDSALGVVLEYDQRVYRTNNGRLGGTPANQGGGDGIAVYLANANPPSYGNAAIDTTVGEAGGYGAGLGYSAVSSTGDAWCAAQQGVPGGYIGVGFDVYGNYQKSEKEQGFGQYHRATRPDAVASGNPAAYVGVDGSVKSTRIPQSIGLRGSGVRYTTTPSCNAGSTEGMSQAYGVAVDPEVNNPGYVTFYSPIWNGGAATDYRFQYQTADDVWHNWYTAEASTRSGSTSGYMQARVPDSAKPIKAFAFQRTTNLAQYRDVTNPSGDGIVVADNNFSALGSETGGYRWLAGTGNLSSYPNPTTTGLVSANQAALQGAVIDNTAADSTDYRRVRITVTPQADGSREVKVFWTPKIDVADDRCYNADGVEITGVSANGTTDTCTAAGGTWRYGGTYPYQEQFSYNVAESSYQADLPDQFRLGFSASTGWAVNFHQIRNLRVTSVVDLELEKNVQFVSASGGIDSGAWADAATGHAGDTVAYRVQAWNNGLADLDPAYPATIVDGFTEVPFDDPGAVTWTATASAGAQICAAWVAATLDCTSWVTSLSGTGPLTDAAPLRWHGPSRTEAPTAGVTVTFTGAIDAEAAPATYPNTAVVAASRAGGPQEDDVSNNEDSASITLLPGWTLEKTSDPVSGSIVEAGETIEYTVAAEALSAGAAGDVPDVTVTDSLAEVATYADFVPGSVRINGSPVAPPVVVTEPSTGNAQTLTVAGLDLPGGTPVAITYQVVVKDPVAPNGSFRNYVLGDAPGNPPVQCADDAETDYLENCSTEHSTPAIVQVLKVGENSEGETIPFSGSEWVIHGDDGGAPDETDVIAELGPDGIDEVATGLFQTSLAPGVYWLTETRALDGFNLLPDPVQFTVAADGGITLAAGNSIYLTACPATPAGALCPLIPTTPTDYSANPTIVVADIPILDLPEAGGTTAPTPFYLGGVLLLVLAGGGIAAILIRRRIRAASPAPSLELSGDESHDIH